ncbi:hypothetical protein BH10BAC2_BH10BAC2_40700 [soil metagenome]
MVNVGFICEGASDLLLYQSDQFKNFLFELNINRVGVINAEGCGNLLPHNIQGYIKSLENQGAERIVIFTDLDEYPCFTERKKQINARAEDIIIIAAKEMEAWFLADSLVMKRLLRIQHFNFENPEQDLEPLVTINNFLVHHIGRGVGISTSGKIKLVKRILDFGHDFKRPGQHENCPSASYMIDKLRVIGNI